MRRLPLAILMLALVGCERDSPATRAAAEPVEPGPADRQIAEALSPLPEGMRAETTVLGYVEPEGLVVLRDGDGPMRCLADDPADDRWHVACYHQSLEPFMARGRELRAQGREREEVQRVREEEIESGALPFPEHPAALYSLTGSADSYDRETGAAGTAPLYVLYVPYATPERLGISPEPSRERPWLMFPGKPWAHLMIAGAPQEPATREASR